MKKFILTVLMLSVMLTVVFASPMHVLAAKNGNTVLIMKGKENVEDKEIEIDVTVKENAGVCGILLSLVYDTSVFTLTDLEYGDALSSLSPINTNTETPDGYGVYPFKITYLGDENDTSTGKMMTLRFSVRDDAPDGSYTIALQYSRDKDVTYLEGNEILTKNLLIDNAKVTLSESKITDIDIIPDENGQGGFANDSGEMYLLIAVCSLTMAGGCFVLVSVLLKRKKPRKWKKI